MAYELARIERADGSAAVDARELRRRIERLRIHESPRLRRLWAYYRNPMRPMPAADASVDRPYRQAQEWGLPYRITGLRSGSEVFGGEPAGCRREVVIENDIGWRVETMVDYLFGKPLVIRSTAPDASRRQVIDRLVLSILEHNGGLLFLQQLALLGAVYGFVDVLVKLESEAGGSAAATGAHGGERCGGGGGRTRAAEDSGTGESAGVADEPRRAPQSQDDRAGGQDGEPGRPTRVPAGVSAPQEAPTSPEDAPQSQWPQHRIERLARRVRLEVVEPSRALPILSPQDYRRVDAYAQCWQMERPQEPPRRGRQRPPWWQRMLRSAQEFVGSEMIGGGPSSALVVEIIGPRWWQRYEDERLAAQGPNALGRIPLVHIQNTSVPFEYAGTSDVEGLIPLQDELNLRLSDRANRIALQSFKMYLGKGIDDFTELPVGPGRMWKTDNENAVVQEFGGDAACPSEMQHIADVREAMDKVSAVSPIAAGAIKDRIGRLTSAAALRVTLMALLSRTEKKRTTYGQGLARMVELALAWLDRAGLFATAPEERGVELNWPSPLPENAMERLQEAQAKMRLGVAREVVLGELGY
jgi:hypothetical protein